MVGVSIVQAQKSFLANLELLSITGHISALPILQHIPACNGRSLKTCSSEISDSVIPRRSLGCFINKLWAARVRSTSCSRSCTFLEFPGTFCRARESSCRDHLGQDYGVITGYSVSTHSSQTNHTTLLICRPCSELSSLANCLGPL